MTTSYWPVIRVHTNGYSLPNRGRGIIIADSDFTINGSNMWDGIILVGGQLTSNGNNVTAGATLSGLNFLIGGTPTTGKQHRRLGPRTDRRATSTIPVTSTRRRRACVGTS